MSGIVGIFNLDGEPVDSALLESMIVLLAARGPDAQQTWIEHSVGFGFALLRTGAVQANEMQPCTIDGRSWIVADARIDDQITLRQRLAAAGATVHEPANDAELILHAYAVWGEACVEHLHGDFAFAIWDHDQQRLFCARDHFGVKPFFYAQVQTSVLFSSDLRCIRCHPGISTTLNEIAVADFLLFEQLLDTDATTFADIHRLPPAHTLAVSQRDRTVTRQRYWSPPQPAELHYKNAGDYVDHFLELFRQAVGDRLRSTNVGVFMSGGLDSTSVAAVARELLSQQTGNGSLTAYTLVYDRLLPDQERHFAQLAAEHLNIPIRFQPLDEFQLFAGWTGATSADFCLAEPTDISLRMRTLDFSRQVWQGERVMLSGIGGDPLLYPEPTHFASLLRHRQFGRMMRDAVNHVRIFHRIPPLYLRTWLRQRGKAGDFAAIDNAFPNWIQPDWAQRLQLRQRWRQFARENDVPASSGATTRPTAHHQLSISLWPTVFDAYDPLQSAFACDVRHPFFDIRLVNFLLALPPIPWCVDKSLLRKAMVRYLPEAIRLRPKTPMAGAPVHQMAAERSLLWREISRLPDLTEYVIMDNMLANDDVLDYEQFLGHLRAISLGCWLQFCA